MFMKRSIIKSALTVCALGAIGATLTTAPNTAWAKWPEKPVRIVVPFAPGGSNDVIARRLGESLRQSTGEAFVVENRAGAGGVVGAAHVAKSDPDGYTVLFTSSSLATAAGAQKTPYDTKTAFEPVSKVASAPFVLLTREDFPAKNIEELVAYAKANPGKINYGSAGLGDNAQLMSELLSMQTGMKMQGIAYKGITPAQIDLVTGRIDILFTTIASIMGTPANDLPKIAFTGAERDPDYPNVPTVKEQTGLDYVINVYWGIYGPAGMDQEARDTLNAEIAKAVKAPEFQKFIKSLGANIETSTPDELRAQLSRDVDTWTETATHIGIRPK